MTATEAEARRDHAAEIDKCIRAVIDEAPPLTTEQRARIAALLRAGDPR